MQVRAAQPDSARAKASHAGVQHLGEYDAEITVGATPIAAASGHVEGVMLHHCSSNWRVTAVRKQGDGYSIPLGCPVHHNDGPRVDRPAFLRFETTVVSNGALRTRGARKVRTVPVPSELHSQAPWAWSGGDAYVADHLGYATVDEMFEKEGQLVS